MEIKSIPLFPRKSRKTQDEAILDLDPQLRHLEEQYLVMATRELRAVRYSKKHQGENPRAECKLMNAYFGLGVARKALEGLPDARSLHELCQTVSETCTMLKMLNRISGQAMGVLVDRGVIKALEEGQELDECLRADKERFGGDLGGLVNPMLVQHMDKMPFENASLEKDLNSLAEYIKNLEKEP